MRESSKKLRYFSTFAGIGGFEIGIGERGECVGYSEIDPHAIHIYQHHFPQHKNYGDITKLDAEHLPDFDLLVGGFPCQAFSIAGRRGGFSDTRGTLFFDLARVLKAKRPSFFVFENVKGLLSHDQGRTFGTIIRTLDELGYDCQWQVLNSKNHGVPQNRERVFIIGHTRGIARPKVFPFYDSGEAIAREVASTTVDANYSKGIDNHGARTAIIQLNEPTHSNDRVYDPEGISPTLNTMQGERRQPFIRVTKDGFHHRRDDKKKSSIQGTHVTFPQGKSHALSTAHVPMTINETTIRRLTPLECERLQGFPDNWTKVEIDQTSKIKKAVGIKKYTSDTQRYKTIGNAVTTNVVRDIIDKLTASR